jgi:NADPH2:quinone reductase
MRALVCTAFGSFDDLKAMDVAIPAPGPGEVAIRVALAGVSFAHSLVVAGKYQRRPPVPFVPGTECVGTVEAVGPGVEDLALNQPVCAVLDWGGYAEVALARREGVFALPETVDLGGAVALPISYGTSYGALVWRGGVTSGQRVVVLGAASGVGLAACEIARALGARVLPVATGAEKRAALAARGFDATIDGGAEHLREAVLAHNGGEGADLVFDPIGGEKFNEALRCLADGGRLLSIGYASGTIPQVGANILLLKNIGVLGFNWGEYVGWGPTDTRERHAQRVRAALAQLMDWWQAGRIAPTLHAAFALEDFSKAMQAVISRGVIGRVALQPSN